MINLCILLLLFHAIKYVNGNRIPQRNHKLCANLRQGTVNDLRKKLCDNKLNKKCNVISCIGAKKCEQRYKVENDLKLDTSLSSAISGPLEPRYDLWELETNNGYTLLLDTEIPAGVGNLENPIDMETVLKFCNLSRCILIYFNEGDLEKVKDSFELNTSARNFIKYLSKDLTKSFSISKTLYIILPSIKLLNKKYGSDNIKSLDNIKNTIKRSFRQDIEVHVMDPHEYFNISRFLDNFTQCTNPKDISSIIASIKDPHERYISVLCDYFKSKYFNQHEKLIKSLLIDACNGNMMRDFGIELQSSLIDSMIRFYLSVFHLQSSNVCINVMESIKNEYNVNVNDGYLKLMAMIEEDIKLQLRNKLSNLTKMERLSCDYLVDDMMDEYDSRIKEILPLMNNEWLNEVIKGMRHDLNNKVVNIIKNYAGLPNPSSIYKKEEGIINESYEQSQKNDYGIRFILGLTAMIREHGYGNRQAFVNYNYGPLILTIGYANDRDVAENKPGTGLMTPAFRLQPKLHFNVNI